jgi:hypothetical protein
VFVRGALFFSMRVWFGRLVPLTVKLPLATLKLDNQSAHLFRQPGVHDWKLLPERVSKNLERIHLHRCQRGRMGQGS